MIVFLLGLLAGWRDALGLWLYGNGIIDGQRIQLPRRHGLLGFLEAYGRVTVRSTGQQARNKGKATVLDCENSRPAITTGATRFLL